MLRCTNVGSGTNGTGITWGICWGRNIFPDTIPTLKIDSNSHHRPSPEYPQQNQVQDPNRGIHHDQQRIKAR